MEDNNVLNLILQIGEIRNTFTNIKSLGQNGTPHKVLFDINPLIFVYNPAFNIA